MNQIKNFEDLIAWKKARVFTKKIYTITGQGTFSRDFGLVSQIRRASVSIMSNIAEGFERSGLREFHKFLAIAKSSSAEVRSHLYVALDTNYLSKSNFLDLNAQIQEVTRIIGGLKRSVRKKIQEAEKRPPGVS